MESQKVKLQSSDKVDFEVDMKVAQSSEMIKEMLENYRDDCKEEVIPLPNVNGAIMSKIFEWIDHHKDDPEKVADDENTRSPDMTNWEINFMAVNDGILFQLLNAADYLNIKGLLNIGCKIVANKIKGKSPEQIREMLDIQSDFTPEEEKQVLDENKLLKEK